MLRSLFFIGFGGGLGSIARYLVSSYSDKCLNSIFPFGTFIVNVLGCLLIGVLLALSEHFKILSPDLKFFVITGFCGGFTTFSTFTAENIALLQSGNYYTAGLYIVLSLIVCVVSVAFGMESVKWLFCH